MDSAEQRAPAEPTESSPAEPLGEREASEPAGSSPDLLCGELGAAPRSALATALLALCGALLVIGTARLVARWVLMLRREGRLRLTPAALELDTTTSLLGRPLGSRRTLHPIGEIDSIRRESRYGRLGTHVGLVALSVGTYFGVTLVVDGVRVIGGSVPLVVAGLGLVLAGVVLDLLLSRFLDSARQRCQVVIRPRRGRAFSLSRVDPDRADQLLDQLRARLELPAAPTE